MPRLVLLLCLAIHAAAALADEPTPVLDVPRLAVAPAMTAASDDPAWAAAAVIPALGVSRKDAKDGVAPDPVPTEVRLGWDAQFLYIRFRCTDGEIYTPVSGRDAQLYRGDVAEVFLDVVGDGLCTVELQVNPRGDLFDQLILLTAPMRSQPSGLLVGEVMSRDLWTDIGWNLDGLRTSAVVLPDGSGWIADLAIPAKAALRRLGLKTYGPMELRINLMRYEWPAPAVADGKRDLLAMNWSTVQFGCPHISPSRKGTLRLVEAK